MGEVPVTRTHLESLATSDLIKMADSFGIDIPPDLDRIFIIEELLEITFLDGSAANADISAAPAVSPEFVAEFENRRSCQERGSSPETDMADSGLVESVPLPRQYNITFIEVMIRDPFWAFVFWEIKAQDKEQFEKDEDFAGYYLKVSPWLPPALASAATGSAQPEGVFTVPVSQNDTAWYLGLSAAAERRKPSVTYDQKQYKIELCAGTKEGEMILAVSNPFRMPFLHKLPAGWEARPFAAENPIVMLSGYEDFHVVRSNERLPRTKRSASAEPL